MDESISWLRCALGILATWRVTYMLAREDGPMDILVRLRARLGTGRLGGLMDCFTCLSVWVAAPIALLVCRESLNRLLAWLALSGAACLLERMFREPVLIQPLPEPKTGDTQEGDTDYGMLRTETSGAHERHPNGSGAA